MDRISEECIFHHLESLEFQKIFYSPMVPSRIQNNCLSHTLAVYSIILRSSSLVFFLWVVDFSIDIMFFTKYALFFEDLLKFWVIVHFDEIVDNL